MMTKTEEYLLVTYGSDGRVLGFLDLDRSGARHYVFLHATMWPEIGYPVTLPDGSVLRRVR